MATEIKIHRGNQIGGCITEIWTEKTRILIDFGEELPGSKNPERFEMDWEASDNGRVKKPAVSAVFFTHYHGDHIGRFAQVPEGVQLCMSPLAREVLVNIHDALFDRARKLLHWKGVETYQEEMEREEKILNILRNKERVRLFEPGDGRMMKPVEIGDISVTPCRVDHSASEACMFLIQAAGKNILHTGDFRGHGLAGENGAAVQEDIRVFRQKKQIDTLIIEGTMMSRRNEKLYSENDLLRGAKKLFAESGRKYFFLLISSTNLDSILTFYQAARDIGLPMYCHSDYFARQLKTLGKYAREHLNIDGLERIKRFDQISDEEKHQGFVTLISAYRGDLVEKFMDCDPVVIYSMWQGYVTRQPGQGRDERLHNFIRGCQSKGITVIPSMNRTRNPYGPMHTSGHADPELITKVIEAANPGELRPIHTEDVWGFLGLKISDELKRGLQKRMEEEAIKAGYCPKADRRALSDTALKKFLPKSPRNPEEGPYYKFVRLVEKHPKQLAFCFRGNSGNAAIIYYKNHVMFHITSTGKVKFNFDHARYMTDWKERKALLEKEPYQYSGFGNVQKGSGFISTGYVTMPAERAAALTLTDLERLYGCFAPMIREFSQEEKLVEKSVQQKLFLTNKKLKDGYYFYDMEFVQPYGKVLGCKNQPDMLAIRFNGAGEPTHLALVEVKSKRSSVRGESGLAAHIIGMEQYPEWLMEARRKDAYLILKQYMDLGLLKRPEPPLVETQFEKLPKEVLLIFTGQDTIDELDTPLNEGDTETIKDFLTGQNYVEGELPGITLDGETVPMAVYRKGP